MNMNKDKENIELLDKLIGKRQMFNFNPINRIINHRVSGFALCMICKNESTSENLMSPRNYSDEEI